MRNKLRDEDIFASPTGPTEEGIPSKTTVDATLPHGRAKVVNRSFESIVIHSRSSSFELGLKQGACIGFSKMTTFDAFLEDAIKLQTWMRAQIA
jgi:hypothetical protein